MGLRFSEDGESIHVYVMTGSLWVQKTFSTASIVELHRSLCAPHRAIATSSPEPPSLPSSRRYAMFTSDQNARPRPRRLRGTRHASLHHRPQTSSSTSTGTSRNGGCATPPPHTTSPYLHASRASSSFTCTLTPQTARDQLSDEEEKHQRRKAWHVVQYYTTSERPLSRKSLRLPAARLLDDPPRRVGLPDHGRLVQPPRVGRDDDGHDDGGVSADLEGSLEGQAHELEGRDAYETCAAPGRLP